MGSGKLIPLPQVSSVLTWISAYLNLPAMLAFSVRTFMCQVQPLRVSPDPFRCFQTSFSTLSHTVWLSPSKLTRPLQDLLGLEIPGSILLTGCPAWLCAQFLVHIIPLRVFCGLVISLATRLGTLVCAILLSRHSRGYPLRNKPS
jgi:hypothetical protein